jgi:hypothetical protein
MVSPSEKRIGLVSTPRVRSRLEPDLRARVSASLDYLPGLIRGE